MLAERAGVSLATIEALEGDRRRQPYPHTVAALAEALGLSADERAALRAAVPLREQFPAPAPVVDATGPAGRVQLPVPPTPLIGREADVAAAAALLDPVRSAARLLTLTGPGGVGKTRLALAVAAAVIDAYPDGIVFVDLAPLRDQRLVPATIAHALGLHESGGQKARDMLLDYVRERQVLVLDNFEHLLGAAPLLAELLESCPQLALLVTSRAALRLRAEQRFLVAPLATPADELPSTEVLAASPAVRLFVDRARAVTPDFALDASNVLTVAAICRRLDGMPLAIELAAARVGLLRPEALLRRLEHRLPMLTGGAPDLPERQQTLRQTLAWSYDLLGAAEQVLFRRLAVFAAGFTLEAAEAVVPDTEGSYSASPSPRVSVSDVLDGLADLAHASLLARPEPATGEPTGEQRFRMLETVREYARERLEASGEEAAVRARHCDWCLALAEAAEPALVGHDQLEWLARLNAEHDNLRAALAWSIDRDLQKGVRLAGALARFWHMHSYYTEGRRWLEAAVQRAAAARVIGAAQAAASAEAKAFFGAGLLARFQGDLVTARGHLEAGLSLEPYLEERGLVAWTRREMAELCIFLGEYARARTLLRDALAISRAIEDQRGAGTCLELLGWIAEQEGDYRQAATLHEESLAMLRAAGDRWSLGNTLRLLSRVALIQGDAPRAQALGEEALALARELGSGQAVGFALRKLAEVACWQGAMELAAALFTAALAVARDLGDRTEGAWNLVGLRPEV